MKELFVQTCFLRRVEVLLIHSIVAASLLAFPIQTAVQTGRHFFQCFYSGLGFVLLLKLLDGLRLILAKRHLASVDNEVLFPDNRLQLRNLFASNNCQEVNQFSDLVKVYHFGLSPHVGYQERDWHFSDIASLVKRQAFTKNTNKLLT